MGVTNGESSLYDNNWMETSVTIDNARFFSSRAHGPLLYVYLYLKILDGLFKYTHYN